ncbi:hypothetical protein niasHT_014165 [Heterodera trifolii]|uniref:Uncharacterized protein n=1 Tax=Heterodera trifolii TaxID=157864 RepID=A0ABD2KX20_9BILA
MKECLNGLPKPGSSVKKACDSANNCWCQDALCVLCLPCYLTHLALGCAVCVPIDLACTCAYASSCIGCASFNGANKAMIKRKLKKNEKHLKDITPQ